MFDTISTRVRKKQRTIIAISLLVAALLFLVLFLGLFKPNGARMFIDSSPPATVMINGEQIGRTPFEKDFTEEEVSVRLIPDIGERPLVAYETKVALEGGIKTIIYRQFAESEEASSGEVVSFEKIGGRDAEISIISTPDGANIKLDGVARGATPIKVAEVKPGIHQLSVTANGYGERTFPVQAVAGYRLIAVVKLPLTGDALPLASPAPTPVASTEKKIEEIEILTTPTGFLRVRSEPLVASSEVARVTPGKKYKFLEKDDNSGWFKIQISESISGWITNDYATASATQN